MGLFSKKKEEKSMLPDLPESSTNLPELPAFGKENSNMANLNADVPMNNNSVNNSSHSVSKTRQQRNAKATGLRKKKKK